MTERGGPNPFEGVGRPDLSGVLGDRLAQAAVAPIAPGMIVGLGTGRTSGRALRALAQRVRDEGLDIDCVCTSSTTEREAIEYGLPVISFAEVERVDYLFDGAGEVDRQLRMLKGHYAAITRQRLVASVAERRVYLAPEDHYTEKLGTKMPLTITIIPFGIAAIRNRLRDLGYSGVVRKNLDGELFITDGGGVVLDVRLPDRAPEEMAEELDHVVGVVDHGIFLNEADEVLVELSNGDVRRVARAEAR